MACIINGQNNDGFVYFSNAKGCWVWVKPSGSREDLYDFSQRDEDHPKLKAKKDMLFILYPDGWIAPTLATVRAFDWRRSAEGLVSCMQKIAAPANTRPTFTWSTDRSLVSKGWRARLSPFLVKHPNLRGDECRHYGFALQFYPKWEDGEEGAFLTLVQPDDWDWVRSAMIRDVSIDDPHAFDEYWRWRKKISEKGSVVVSANRNKRKPKGSGRKKVTLALPRRGLSQGNLTRKKESMSDSDERAISRNLDSGRT